MVICITKYLLGEKKELSKVWLAAHWEKKIKRTQIFEVDIVKSVRDILEAEIILDLRISGHLLVGIVKIHSRKAKYLLSECNSIFYQVKIFRRGLIDLPENKQTAAVKDITLTEYFDDFDDIENNLIDSMLTENQTLIEEITLKETSEKLTLLDDDDFKDFVFHEEDEPITFEDFPLSFDNQASQMKQLEIPVNINGAEAVKKTYNKQTKTKKSYITAYNSVSKDFDSENFIDEIPESIEIPNILNEDEVIPLSDNLNSPSIDFSHKSSNNLLLEPLRIQTYNVSKNKKTKKRKLHVDYIKTMAFEVIKKQVLDTSDITSVLDLTPATRRLMVLKEIGCAKHLLRFPALRFPNPMLLKLFQRNLKTCSCDENFELCSSEKESFENVNSPRKKTKMELSKNNATDKNVPKSFDSISINTMRDNMENNIDNDFLDFYDNPMIDTELENVTRNQREERDQLVPGENMLNTSVVQISDSNNIQSTQVSKTSEERWEYALQGKIIHMLQHLKLLFEQESVICFSSVTQNKKKSWVAQQFLCLLMLQKFQVISLKQTESFGEIFILPQVNFDIACTKFFDI